LKSEKKGGRKDLEGGFRRDGGEMERKITPDPLTLYFVKCPI
jgi:hypothetical protein